MGLGHAAFSTLHTIVATGTYWHLPCTLLKILKIVWLPVKEYHLRITLRFVLNQVSQVFNITL